MITKLIWSVSRLLKVRKRLCLLLLSQRIIRCDTRRLSLSSDTRGSRSPPVKVATPAGLGPGLTVGSQVGCV